MRGFLSCLFVMLALAACGNGDQNGAPGGEPGMPGGAPPVSVSVPLKSEIIEWDEYTGRFEAVESVDIQARVSGYLESIHYEDGQLVKKGDLLFVIDPRPFEAVVERAEAEVERAEARVQYTTTEAQRAEELVGRGNISREQFDLRVQERSQALAELDAMRADLKTARLDLEFTRIKAPVGGRISDNFVSVGNLVAGGNTNATVLTRIVSLNPIYFVFDGSESAYLNYQRLQQAGDRPSSRDAENPVQIRLSDEKDFMHTGYMDFVDNRVDPNTGTIRGRAVVENTDYFLTPGVFGRMRLRGRDPYDGLLLPDSAIMADQSLRLVYVVGPDNVIAPRPVVPGPMYRGLRIIRDGLADGDRVVLDGLMMLRPGMPVAPQDGAVTFNDQQGGTR